VLTLRPQSLSSEVYPTAKQDLNAGSCSCPHLIDPSLSTETDLPVPPLKLLVRVNTSSDTLSPSFSPHLFNPLFLFTIGTGMSSHPFLVPVRAPEACAVSCTVAPVCFPPFFPPLPQVRLPALIPLSSAAFGHSLCSLRPTFAPTLPPSTNCNLLDPACEAPSSSLLSVAEETTPPPKNFRPHPCVQPLYTHHTIEIGTTPLYCRLCAP